MADPSTLPIGVAIRAEHVSKTFSVSRRLGGVRSVWSRRRSSEVATDEDDDDPGELDGVEPIAESGRPQRMEALRDVSFTAKTGSVVGIIGEAGAGKTTLLRILGRVIPPTAGRIVIAEPIAPPFTAVARALQQRQTGEQNLPHIACLLGLPRDALTDRADDIFAFANLQAHRNLDVSRWARGFMPHFLMSVMLHIPPRVLLSDGAPVTGDSEFRERCGQRVEELTRSGMTVVMTCKDTKTLRRYAQHALLLSGGAVIADGSVDAVAEAFEKRTSADAVAPLTRLVAPDAARRIGARDRLAEKAVHAAMLSERTQAMAARAEQRRAEKAAHAAALAERTAAMQARAEKRQAEKAALQAARARREERQAQATGEDPQQPAIEVLGMMLVDGDGAKVLTASQTGNVRLQIRFAVTVAGVVHGRAVVRRPDDGFLEKLGLGFIFDAPAPTVLEATADIVAGSLPAGTITTSVRLALDGGEPIEQQLTFEVLAAVPAGSPVSSHQVAWEVGPVAGAEPLSGPP